MAEPSERPGGIAGDPVIAGIGGAVLLFPGICSLAYMFARPNDWFIQAFAQMFLLLGIPMALIGLGFLYNAFRHRSSGGRRGDAR
jgi:hypothetical protein